MRKLGNRILSSCSRYVYRNHLLAGLTSVKNSTVEEMKEHALKYEKTLILQTMQDGLMDYKKAKLAHNKLTEQLAGKMKEEGITDLLIMSAGPYKHNSCMSAYCVDAQKMADAAGMLCWTSDGMIRYFSQVLFRG